MKEFWMVVQTYPDVPDAQPMVMGPPCLSFEDACEKAMQAYKLNDDCPVVILHTVARLEKKNIPSMAEAIRNWRDDEEERLEQIKWLKAEDEKEPK